MLSFRLRIAGFLAFAALFAFAPAAPPLAAEVTTAVQANDLEAQDRLIVQRALRAKNDAEFQAMTAELRAVLEHAPAHYPQIERNVDQVIVRADWGQEGAAAALGVVAAMAANSKNVRVEFNTYPTAAFLLGSYAVSRRQPEAAIGWLDRGLILQPANLRLVTEKGSALVLLKRFAEALRLYDDAAGSDAATLDTSGHARLLRARGFVLTELDRLEDAEASYRASLELEPDNGGAQAELKYILQRRGGAERKGFDVFTSDQVKKANPRN